MYSSNLDVQLNNFRFFFFEMYLLYLFLDHIVTNGIRNSVDISANTPLNISDNTETSAVNDSTAEVRWKSALCMPNLFCFKVRT